MDARRLSAEAIGPEDGWKEHVVHVDGPTVAPETVEVVGRDAEVTEPSALAHEGGGATTLRTSGEHSTLLKLDLGRIVMGHVEIAVRRIDGAPLRASYAEFEQFLSPEGDGMGAPFGTDAHPWSRVDVFEPSADATVFRSPGKRELRYLAITLDGPGEAVIDFVRVDQTIYPVAYDGYFLSSDDLLNRAWYHSAYTGDLATLSEDGSPWMLTVTYDRVLFMCDLHLQAIAGYYQSSDYRLLVRNTLQQFPCLQNPDGSLPHSSSPLVKCKLGDPGPPDGWRWPEEGPDPDVALGFVGPYSLYHDMTIDTCTAYWVATLADYHLYTGDAEFVVPLLPVARRAVEFLSSRTTDDGLYYEPPDKRIDPDAEIPWVANWSPGDIATGVDSFANSVYHEALTGLARLEEELGDGAEAAERLRRRADDVRLTLIEHLWDPEVGAMVLNDQDPRRDHAGDANAGSLMFEILDQDRASAAMRFLATTLATSHGTRSSELDPSEAPDGSEEIVIGFKHNGVFRASDMQGYINSLEALGRVRYGDGDGAIDLIRRWWGHMLANGPGTGWFAWNNDGSVDRDAFANTSWTTALPALSEGILGIRPKAAGYSRWEVAPKPGDLEWAQGSVPVPDGSIASRWRRTETSFVLTVEAPEHSEGDVAVPLLGEQRDIAMDGELVWREGAPLDGVEAAARNGSVVFSGIRGGHTFAWA